jgi:hypothetical protein
MRASGTGGEQLRQGIEIEPRSRLAELQEMRFTIGKEMETL